MGKKKNKNRELYLDDESPLYVAPTATTTPTDDNDEDDNTNENPTTTTATTPTTSTKTNNSELDLEKTIKPIYKQLLQDYPDKSNDWYERTLEKNLKLKKKSLMSHGDALVEMRYQLEEELDQEAEEEEEGQVDKDEKEEEEERQKAEEARARAEARVMGTTTQKNKKTIEKKEEEEKEETKSTTSNLPNNVPKEDLSPFSKLLLSLYPYGTSSNTTPPPPTAFAILYTVLFYILSLISSSTTLQQVEAIYEQDAPNRIAAAEEAEAQRLEQEEVEDDEKRHDHLWSPDHKNGGGKWIPINAIYNPPSSDNKEEEEEEEELKHIKYERGRWERWAKNLKTKTKKGGPKGSWVLIKVGDGWSSAPLKLETPNENLTDSDIRFYGCIAKHQVIDCTDWVVNTLVTKSSARALGVVDNGRVLFTFSNLNGKEEGKGVDGWVLDKYVPEEEQEDGGGGGGGKKSKKSRAEKRSKKMGYSR